MGDGQEEEGVRERAARSISGSRRHDGDVYWGLERARSRKRARERELERRIR